MKKHIKEVSSAGISTTSDGEPDFGNWLGAGKIRKLGAEMSGDADKWFRTGGYIQTEFPQPMIYGVVSLMNSLHLILILVFIESLLPKN